MSEPTAVTLTPFVVTAQTTKLAIAATATRNQDWLSISYCLQGDLTQVVIPATGQDVQRKDRLWEQTCFEFFLGEGLGEGSDGVSAGRLCQREASQREAFQGNRSHTSPYWEFNLSPTGDWNVFSLQGYRQGLKEESAFSSLPFTLRTSASALNLDISVNIGSLITSDQPLRLGISSVLLLASHQESFWAIAHPAAEADFHHPDSFAIALQP
jgi:hypothetical protein